jgi:hypothetical protein
MMQVPLSTAGKLIKVGSFKVSGIVYLLLKNTQSNIFERFVIILIYVACLNLSQGTPS